MIGNTFKRFLAPALAFSFFLSACGEGRPKAGWTNPKLDAEITLNEVTYMAPSNWASASTDDGWYYYPFKNDDSTMVYVRFRSGIIIDKENAEEEFKTGATGFFGNSDFTGEMVDITGAVAYKARGTSTVSEREFHTLVYFIATDYYMYSFIFGSEDKLDSRLTDFSEEMMASVIVTPSPGSITFAKETYSLKNGDELSLYASYDTDTDTYHLAFVVVESNTNNASMTFLSWYDIAKNLELNSSLSMSFDDGYMYTGAYDKDLDKYAANALTPEGEAMDVIGWVSTDFSDEEFNAFRNEFATYLGDFMESVANMLTREE